MYPFEQDGCRACFGKSSRPLISSCDSRLGPSMGQSSGRIKSEGGSSTKTLTKRPSVQTDVNGEGTGWRVMSLRPTNEGDESWVPEQIAS